MREGGRGGGVTSAVCHSSFSSTAGITKPHIRVSYGLEEGCRDVFIWKCGMRLDCCATSNGGIEVYVEAGRGVVVACCLCVI